MKKTLIVMIMSLILILVFITLRFGSALFQEGNPIPILISIIKLELTNTEYQQFSATNNEYRYVSKTRRQPPSGDDLVKEFMKEKDWYLKEQAGSGLIFEKNGETVVIGTRQYSRHYFLWNVPHDVNN